MTSEEQYLDDLLKNMMVNEPKPRTMKDVMREMGVNVPEEPVVEVVQEPIVEEPVVEVAQEPIVEEPTAEVVEESFEKTEPVETEELVTSENLDAIDMSLDDLANMLDNITLDEEPTSSEVLPADVETPVAVNEKVFEEVQPEELSVDELDDILSALEDIPVEETGDIQDENDDAKDIPVDSVIDDILPELDELLKESSEASELSESLESLESSESSEEFSDDELLKMLENAATAEDFVMPESRLSNEDIILDEVDTEEAETEELPIEETEALTEEVPEIPIEDTLEEVPEILIEDTSEDVPEIPVEDTLEEIPEIPIEDTSEEVSEIPIEDSSEMLSDDMVDNGALDSLDDLDFDQESLEALLAGLDMPEDDSTDSNKEEEISENVITDDAAVDNITAVEEPTDLDKLENSSDSDDDLLALLEGIDAENVANENAAEELEALLKDGLEDENSDMPEEDDKGSKKKKKKAKKGFSLPFGKKNKKKEVDSEENDALSDEDNQEFVDEIGFAEPEPDTESETSELDALIGDIGELDIENDSLDDIIPEKEDRKSKKKKKKKDNNKDNDKEPGFFAKLLAFLTEDLDEEDTEGKPIEDLSNADILAEVDAEAELANIKEKKDKKGKKAKKDKKKGKDKNANAEGGDDEDGEAAEGKKKKKPKKEKKAKEPKEPKEKEPRKVVLSKKAFIGLVCFCITVIAAILIVSILVPDHVEKKQARRAYYLGDYETVYENFYNKKLGKSDTIMFKRAEAIMTLQRRWDSYENRIALNEDEEALDSLIEGVVLYNNLINNDQYGVASELTEIYNKIVEALMVYGLSPEDAKMLYEIEDDSEYTQRLYSVIATGSYALPDDFNDADTENVDYSDDLSGNEDVLSEPYTENSPVDMLEAEEDL